MVLHNASGLLLGYLCALAFRVAERDRRAIVIEGGMQNSGLALGIIAVQFNADLGMVIIASLWGIWHIVSGLTLAIAVETEGCSTGSLKAAPSSTAPARAPFSADVGIRDGRIVEVGRDRRGRARAHRCRAAPG